MKYLKVLVQPIKIKGDAEEMDVLRTDLYEHISAMIENESLEFEVTDEEEEDEE